jgi:hypothetical protein
MRVSETSKKWLRRIGLVLLACFVIFICLLDLAEWITGQYPKQFPRYFPLTILIPCGFLYEITYGFYYLLLRSEDDQPSPL